MSTVWGEGQGELSFKKYVLYFSMTSQKNGKK